MLFEHWNNKRGFGEIKNRENTTRVKIPPEEVNINSLGF
jgi:hypothetical protein